MNKQNKKPAGRAEAAHLRGTAQIRCTTCSWHGLSGDTRMFGTISMLCPDCGSATAPADLDAAALAAIGAVAVACADTQPDLCAGIVGQLAPENVAVLDVSPTRGAMSAVLEIEFLMAQYHKEVWESAQSNAPDYDLAGRETAKRIVAALNTLACHRTSHTSPVAERSIGSPEFFGILLDHEKNPTLTSRLKIAEFVDAHFAASSPLELIQPLRVARDEGGWWSHPGIPDFDEDAKLFHAWLKAQGLETTYKMLEDEADDHPVYVSYFDSGSGDVAGWEPAAPEGEGWFTFSIHDTEDGPAWVWARRDPGSASFQSRVQPWMMECFGPMISGDKEERNHRFLEEALELVQACGCTEDEARQLVAYVYGRPVGEVQQEVGGVMVTLAALCLAQDVDLQQAAEVELARIWTKVDAIRAKQASKPQYSPLPESPDTNQQPAEGAAS